MAAVRSGIEDDVIGPAFDAAFQHRLQRFVGSVVAVERQIVAKHDEAEFGTAQQVHQRGQAFDILTMNLDQLEVIRRLALDVDIGMRRLHQRGLSHAARAPQQRVVGGQTVGKAFGVLDQDVAHPVDALEQAEVDAADAGDGVSRPFGCQTKASAWPNDPCAGPIGAAADRCSAIASSACAIRCAVSSSADAAGRFAATFWGFCAAARAPARDTVLWGFLDMREVPDRAAISVLQEACKGPASHANEGLGGVAIGTAAAIVRANLTGPARAFGRSRFTPVSRGLFEC